MICGEHHAEQAWAEVGSGRMPKDRHRAGVTGAVGCRRAVAVQRMDALGARGPCAGSATYKFCVLASLLLVPVGSRLLRSRATPAQLELRGGSGRRPAEARRWVPTKHPRRQSVLQRRAGGAETFAVERLDRTNSSALRATLQLRTRSSPAESRSPSTLGNGTRDAGVRLLRQRREPSDTNTMSSRGSICASKPARASAYQQHPEPLHSRGERQPVRRRAGTSPFVGALPQ